MRRAVSTAYYALFHLLISEAVANWSQKDLRNALGRAFEHGTMKSASNRVQQPRGFPFTRQNPSVVANLRVVAKAFSQLQEQRHLADYDNSTYWALTEAVEQLKLAETAFAAWKAIRKDKIAQEYLVLLLVKKRD